MIKWCNMQLKLNILSIAGPGNWTHLISFHIVIEIKTFFLVQTKFLLTINIYIVISSNTLYIFIKKIHWLIYIDYSFNSIYHVIYGVASSAYYTVDAIINLTYFISMVHYFVTQISCYQEWGCILVACIFAKSMYSYLHYTVDYLS